MAHHGQRLTGALELRHRRWQTRSLPDHCRIICTRKAAQSRLLEIRINKPGAHAASGKLFDRPPGQTRAPLLKTCGDQELIRG